MTRPDQVTYWNYLKVMQLLDLQDGLDENEDVTEDELHFIIVHQVFELWFKLVIRELQLARDRLAKPHVEEETIPYVVHHLKRINTVLQLAGDHFKLMETLTPQDFLAFRAKLGTASGFQSFQLREIEFIMGLEESQREEQGHGDPASYIMRTADKSPYGDEIISRLTSAREAASLRDALHDWLYRTPIHGSIPTDKADEKVIQSFIDGYLKTMKEINTEQMAKLVEDGGDETQLRKQFDKATNLARQFLQANEYDDLSKKHRVSRIRCAILFIESYRELPLLTWPRLLIDTVVEMEELMVSFRFDHARMVERIIGRRTGTGGSSGVDYLDETTKYRIFPELWTIRTMLVPRERLPDLEKVDMYDFANKFSSR